MLRIYGESCHLMLATLPVEGVYEDCRQIEIKMEKFAQFFVEVTCPPKVMFIELLLFLSFINSLLLFNRKLKLIKYLEHMTHEKISQWSQNPRHLHWQT